MHDVLIIDSPIHSVFITPNTPGSTIPSHGTTKYGEMYAIDFVIVNKSKPSMKPYKSSFISYILTGVNLDYFYGWGEKIYAPVEGKIVKVIDGIEERNPVNIVRDLRNTLKVTKEFEKGEIDSREITGNCVIIQYSIDGYCLLAHMKKGSIQVKEGQTIQKGEIVGELGHSGNSTMPHLHMQFMDSLDLEKANGIPFSIREYAIYKNGIWIKKANELPTKKDIVKSE